MTRMDGISAYSVALGLVAGLAAGAVLLATLVPFARRKMRSDRRRLEAEEQRARGLRCPNCGAIYGPQSTLCGHDRERDELHRRSSLICASCQYLNFFDKDGERLRPPGFPPHVYKTFSTTSTAP
jgi:hypothetical protein